MIALTFRFYAQLNDFLPAHRRYRRFEHIIRAPTSVKDAVEALGIPHPEVNFILVNGTSEDFTCRLRDGDDVAVYPVFRSIDLAGMRRTGTDAATPTRFVLDVHLRKLAALLRLCGFDAVLRDDDGQLAETSAREARIALTRDVGLLKRSVVRHGYWVRHTDPELQLAEVIERFDLVKGMRPFARCLRCNTPIVAVDAGAIADRLPARTRAHFHEFFHCTGCGRVYWQGAHYQRLTQIIERARQRASAR